MQSVNTDGTSAKPPVTVFDTSSIGLLQNRLWKLNRQVADLKADRDWLEEKVYDLRARLGAAEERYRVLRLEFRRDERKAKKIERLEKAPKRKLLRTRRRIEVE